MTKKMNVMHLIKGMSLSSLLFLMGGCQDVTAQTDSANTAISVEESQVVELAEQESDMTLRFEDERKVEELPVSETITEEVDVLEPVILVEETESETPAETVVEEPITEKPLPELPIEEGTIVTEPIEDTTPVTEQSDETKPVEETKEPVKEAPVYTYEPSYETIAIPHETLYVLNDEMDNDQFQILQEGKDGEMIHTWLHAYKDGVWESKHVTKTAVHDPVPKVMMVGTNIVYVPKNSTFENEKARIEALPLVPGAY